MRHVQQNDKISPSEGEAGIAAVRPVWSTPELVEVDVWSVTAAKGSQVTEGGTTRNTGS